ncbi:hypothetical protein [Bradymonas sediminis]|nr:hypothetical protein [Bradymonas sediminis]TDP62930.1 hypothetical protein DFR33_11163 [Bradymonas sediminis]
MLPNLIPILAKSEISARWALFTLGLGALIFIYIMLRLLLEYLKSRKKT